MIDNNRVAIIDYELCNLFSVVNACKYVGLTPVITSDYVEIMSCDAAILPGVGAFGEAIAQIRSKKLDTAIYDFIESRKPFMGVCLGLHLLFDNSVEFGEFKGLGVIPGLVKKIPANYGKVPQIGWNTIEIVNDGEKYNMACALKQNEYMYFIHSYYVEPEREEDILTCSNYGGFKFCSSICRGNVSAFQFHPEKSGKEGVLIYQQFKNTILSEERK